MSLSTSSEPIWQIADASNPFKNCSDYEGSKDDKYIPCLSNTTGDPCDLIYELHKAKEIRGLLAVVPFILSILTLLFNLVFIYLVCLHVFRKRRSSKKRYVFLVNRSISAVIAQILIYVVLITWKTHNFKYSTVTLLLFVGSLSFLMYTLTYVIVSFLLYRAITQPFWYKEYVTIQRCLMLIGITWILSVASSIVLALYVATFFYPESAPIHCSYACQRTISILVVIVFSLCYFVVIFFYLAIVLRIRYKNDASLNRNAVGDERTTRERSITTTRNIRTMNRLSFNLIAFSVSKIPLIIVAAVTLASLSQLHLLGIGTKSICKTFHYSHLFYKVETLATIAAMIWLLGMGLDPIISLCSDPPLIDDLRKRLKHLSQFAASLCGSKGKGRKITRQTTTQTSLDNDNPGEF